MIFPQFTSISVVESPMNIGSYMSLLKSWDIEGTSKLEIDIQSHFRNKTATPSQLLPPAWL